MYIITYLQTNNRKVEPGILFINTEEELARYKGEMGTEPVTEAEFLNLYEESDGFRCIITEV